MFDPAGAFKPAYEDFAFGGLTPISMMYNYFEMSMILDAFPLSIVILIYS